MTRVQFLALWLWYMSRLLATMSIPNHLTYIINQHQNWVIGWKINMYKPETRSARSRRSLNEAWSWVVWCQSMSGIKPCSLSSLSLYLQWGPIVPIQYNFVWAVPANAASVCPLSCCWRAWIPDCQCWEFFRSTIRTVQKVRGSVDNFATSMMKSGSSGRRHCGVTMYPWVEGKRVVRMVFHGPYQTSSVAGGWAV